MYFGVGKKNKSLIKQEIRINLTPEKIEINPKKGSPKYLSALPTALNERERFRGLIHTGRQWGPGQGGRGEGGEQLGEQKASHPTFSHRMIDIFGLWEGLES